MNAVMTETAARSLSPVEQKLADWRPVADIPSWFCTLRCAARDAYFELTAPDKTNESWHYGDPGRYTLAGLDIANAIPGFNGVRYERICGLTGRPRKVACLSMIADNVAEISSSEPLRDAGVTVMALRQALALRGDQLQQYLQSGLVDYKRDRLLASHFALVDNGFFVHIPQGVDAPEPIHLIMETGEPGSVVSPHVLVVAEAGSAAKVFIHFLGGGSEGERSLQLGAVQTHLAAGASVHLTKIQHLGARTDAMTHEAAAIGRDAHYRSVAVHFGGLNVRHETTAQLTHPGGHAELFGMHLLRGRQRYDFFTHQNHQAPHCQSNLLFKGAMLDRSRASYQGLITVAPGAQKTDAYQSNRSLLLSPHARADSSPQLEIQADDVRCTHGSAVSNVGKNELFYMESRGIPQEQARRLLVSGFMAEVADRIPLGVARDYVYNYVLQQMD
jgi:Fe-S cluster assembly protein SufD